LVKSTIGLKDRRKLPKITMSNGGNYEGEWLNGMRDGLGKHVRGVKSKDNVSGLARRWAL